MTVGLQVDVDGDSRIHPSGAPRVAMPIGYLVCGPTLDGGVKRSAATDGRKSATSVLGSFVEARHTTRECVLLRWTSGVFMRLRVLVSLVPLSLFACVPNAALDPDTGEGEGEGEGRHLGCSDPPRPR
jgi:hypothetical protein